MTEAKATAEFDRALRGERRVICLVCRRSFEAVRAGGHSPFRTIWPKPHNSPAPISRARCSGSYLQALLS